MLVACRLAGLSALDAYCAVKELRAQFGPTRRSSGHSGQRAEIRSDAPGSCRAFRPGNQRWFPGRLALGGVNRASRR